MTMKVMLIDKTEIFRVGLAKVLSEQADIQVVAAYGRASEATKKVTQLQPDVVLIDIQMPEGEGVNPVQRLCQLLPDVRVLVLTHSENHRILLSTMKAGARGYVSKDVTINGLVKAIILVAEGGVIVSPPMASSLLNELHQEEASEAKKTTDAPARLSNREQEVLCLIAKGFDTRQIAQALVISDNTVKVHLRNIMEKLHVHTRLQAVLLAQEEGLTLNTTEKNAMIE